MRISSPLYTQRLLCTCVCRENWNFPQSRVRVGGCRSAWRTNSSCGPYSIFSRSISEATAPESRCVLLKNLPHKHSGFLSIGNRNGNRHSNKDAFSDKKSVVAFCSVRRCKADHGDDEARNSAAMLDSQIVNYDLGDLEEKRLEFKIDTEVGDQKNLLLPRVPWGLLTVVGVMTAWILCFYTSYTTLVPAIISFLNLESAVSSLLSNMMIEGSYGLTVDNLALVNSETMHAVRHALLDSLQLMATLNILKKSLNQYYSKTSGLFLVKWKPLASWIPMVVAGFCIFPVLEWVHGLVSVGLFGANPSVGAPSPSAAWQAWPLRALWLFVLGVAAPIWEEFMFRGFLLPSLARYMKPALALLVSSSIFMMMHFSRNAFPAVLFLGILCGAVYMRSGNLLPCIMIHGGWNAFLLVKATI